MFEFFLDQVFGRHTCHFLDLADHQIAAPVKARQRAAEKRAARKAIDIAIGSMSPGDDGMTNSARRCLPDHTVTPLAT